MQQRSHPSGGVAAVAVLLAVLANGCAHLPAPGSGVSGLPAATGLRDEDLSAQHLLRVRYRGSKGSGALRVILKLEARDRYRVETKDRFGRGVWTVEAIAGEILFVDERSRLYCRSRKGVRIPEIALESLPLGELPAVLLGRLPGDLTRAGEGEYRDSDGRRWTVVGQAMAPESWTVWEDGEPWLWWRDEGESGGLLSHRTGSQLRWRRVANEPLAAGLPKPDLGDRYTRVGCDEWAASTGAGRASGAPL